MPDPRHRREHPIRWMVARERFQLPPADPPAGEPEGTLAEVVGSIFKTIDARRQPALLDRVREAWPRLADPAVAAHARPARIDRQTLYVYVDRSVWLQEIARFHRARLLDALRGTFGDAVRDIRLQIEPDRPRAGAPGRPAP